MVTKQQAIINVACIHLIRWIPVMFM